MDEALALDWVGSPCGHHGTYTFYKAIKATGGDRRRVLALGDFFFVKLWPDQDIISIGELQLLWEDDKANGNAGSGNSSSSSSSASSTSSTNSGANSASTPLASLKLYFLPENTPDGRLEEHGEDEVISISEKVVIRVSDLTAWITDDVKWERGAPAVWERQCLTPPATPPLERAAACDEPATPLPIEPCIASRGALDMRDVAKEKQSVAGEAAGACNVIVLGYPAYCRYRSTLKRLEGHNHTDYMRQAVVEALGGRVAPSPNTRVVFCKSTFDYPELEDHELLCNHLAPKWKGRPRKAAKKTPMRSHSPGSESNESESSVSTITSSIKSKDSPLKNRPVPITERSKGEQLFLNKLHKFMAGRGTPIGRLPSLGFKQLDLYSFYTKVQRAGGYDSAVANKQWKGIYIELGGHPSNTSAATCTRRHYEKLLLPYEQHANATGEDPIAEAEKVDEAASNASKDLSPVASSSNPTATPPKKRKLSSEHADLPFELPAEIKERLRLVAESSNMTLGDLMSLGDPSILAAAAAAMAAVDPKQAHLSALGEMARAVQQQDARKEVKEAKEPDARRPSVIIQKTDAPKEAKSDPKEKAKPAPLGPPPSAHSQKPSHWYAQMIADATRKAGSAPAEPTAMLETAFRPPTPLAATPSIFVSGRRIYDDPAGEAKKARTPSNPPPVARPTATVAPSSAKTNNSAPAPARPSQPVAPTPHQRPPVAPTRPNNGIPLVDLTSRNVKQDDKKPVEVNGKEQKAPPTKPWSGASLNRTTGGDVSISVNVKIENEPKPAVTGGGSSQRHSVSVVPVVKEERHKKEVRVDRVPVPQQQQQQQPQQQQYPRMVDSLMNSAPSKPASSSSYASTSNKSSASSNLVPPAMSGFPGLLDPALASYYSSLYSPYGMHGLPANAFMGHGPGSGMFHHGVPHPHHHQGMVPSSAAAEVTAQVYKDLVQRGYPPALAPGLPPGLGSLPGLSSLGSFASMYMAGSKDPGPGERSLPKS